MVHIIGPKDPKNSNAILTVSISKTWSKGLSPFYLGPIDCYDGLIAKNMENAWQYSKVYKEHLDKDGNPGYKYFQFRDQGWNNLSANRYPIGKNIKPEYTYWKIDNEYKKLDYITARKQVYCKLYSNNIVKTDAWKQLLDLYKKLGEIWLWDFDGYDHRKIGYTYADVFNDPNRKAGHAFILAVLLEREICKD